MSSLSLENFDKSCRWCLSFAGEKKPILESCLDTMLFAITSLKVLHNDGYPQFACRSCIMKLSTAYNFRQMVRRNYEKLSNIVKTTQQKQLAEQMQEVNIVNNIITEADSDHESYAMSAINMKAVETLDDDELSTRDKKGRGCISGQKTIKETDQVVRIIENQAEVTPIVSDYAEAIINAETFLKCRHCPSRFNSIAARKAHALTHTERCKQCNKVVKRQNAARHARTHKQNRPYPCRVCDRRFHDLTNRNSHERIHSKADAPSLNKYLCNYCGKKYQWRTSLCRHLRSHIAHNYVCAVCKLQVADHATLRKHLRSHAKINYLSCPKCKTLKFSSQQTLNNHLRIIHAPARVTYPCAACHRVYLDRASLRRHQAVHSRIPVRCQHCDKTFANNRSLTKHLIVHEKITSPT